ncbi:MAG: H-NS histone family protein [Rhodoferax sp.]|nr:H-NS histone family protein [Rhodoferax sp.]MCB2030124.1 H-NS histone family protein [Rhodoferax sp.]MCP5263825.1 H-NS histone family protein [Rhodoferax sp.]MCW5641917.1 H-NS histone family protein [Rhodoferax sp.]
MGNLLDIQSQIEKLQKQANDIRTREFDKTVQEILAKMQAFGITVKDLQAATSRGAKAGGGRKRQAAASAKGGKASKMAGTTVAPKYRGPNGETWSGRGLMPRWMSHLVDQGAKKEDFAIGA